jgi:hypothetical protein
LLAHELVEAMQAHLSTLPDETLSAPHAYLLLISPGQSNSHLADPAFLSRLAGILEQSGREAGILFAMPPSIRAAIDPDLLPGKHKFVPDFQDRDEASHTAAVEVETARPPGSTQVPPNAYLIIDGGSIYPLVQSGVSIGRRPDNQLVISDLRVSRTHAMLRVVNGQFFVFDLNSLGGTFLNGKRITQAVLRPGDVISLAGVPLIYSQDSPPDPGDDLDHTQTMTTDKPAGGDREAAARNMTDDR